MIKNIIPLQKITIIVPIFNEEGTINKILDKIENQKYVKKQIILVDDFSSDNSLQKLRKYKFKSQYKIIRHRKNFGKGACIISAQRYVKGNIVIIQDADLEYNPNDYKKMIKPIIDKKTKVVYGSRVLGGNRYKNKNFSSLLRVFFNHILTIFSNFINNQNLTDAHTCYKVLDKKVFKSLQLKERRFSFCPEVTTKLSKKKIKIIEVPISYKGRTYQEGKKISFKDGLEAIYVLIKYRYF